MFEELSTHRCKIRRFRPSDVGGLSEVLGDGEVMRYVEPPFDYAKTEKFVEKYGLVDEPKIFALIYDKSKFSESNEAQSTCLNEGDSSREVVAGHVIFHALSDDALEAVLGKGKVYEIGWILRCDLWGRGIASATTSALIEHAKTQGINALVIECVPQNLATIKIADKYRFEECNVAGNLKQFVLPLC